MLPNETLVCLSVIIPIYNTKEYLKKCVTSILNQQVQSMEILLVDDGSTDGSGELCDQLVLLDNRIRVIHKPNGGVNTARNAGLEAASGKYITMIDSDDYLKTDTFQPALRFIENNDVDLVQFPEIYVSQGKETFRDTYPRSLQILTTPRDMIAALLNPSGLFPGGLGGKIYKQSIWQNLRLREDMQFCEDAYIFPKIMEHCHAIALIGEGGYCYVMRDGSATHSVFTPKKRLDCFRLKSIFYETALKYRIYTGFWWNEACFSAIDAWAHWGPCEELEKFLFFLQETKTGTNHISTSKKLAKTAWIFTPLVVAKVNRFRVLIKNKLNNWKH